MVLELDTAWYAGLEVLETCRKIDVPGLLRSWWNIAKSVVTITVFFEDDETTVVIEFFVPYESTMEYRKVQEDKKKEEVVPRDLCCVPVRYTKPNANIGKKYTTSL